MTATIVSMIYAFSFCCQLHLSDTLPVVVNVTGGPSETDIPIPLPEESFSYTFTLQSSGVNGILTSTEAPLVSTSSAVSGAQASGYWIDYSLGQIRSGRGMDKSKSSLSHSEIGSIDRLTVRSHHSATVKFYTEMNVALNRPSAQSSQYGGAASSRALDGNINPSYEKGSCTHTRDDDFYWFMVDLGENYVITSVSITNRDSNAVRLSNFTVSVWEIFNPSPAIFQDNLQADYQQCIHIPGQLGTSETRDLRCPVSTFGRYVALYKESPEALTLCEFMVLGEQDYSPICPALIISSYVDSSYSGIYKLDKAGCRNRTVFINNVTSKIITYDEVEMNWEFTDSCDNVAIGIEATSFTRADYTQVQRHHNVYFWKCLTTFAYISTDDVQLRYLQNGDTRFADNNFYSCNRIDSTDFSKSFSTVVISSQLREIKMKKLQMVVVAWNLDCTARYRTGNQCSSDLSSVAYLGVAGPDEDHMFTGEVSPGSLIGSGDNYCTVECLCPNAHIDGCDKFSFFVGRSSFKNQSKPIFVCEVQVKLFVMEEEGHTVEGDQSLSDKLNQLQQIGFPENCSVIKQSEEDAESGLYWITFPGTTEPVESYCDMSLY